MAFASVNYLWQSGSKFGPNDQVSSNHILDNGKIAAVGSLSVLLVATQNFQSTDGDEGAVSSVTDSSGNSWGKVAECCNGNGAPQAGLTLSVWYSVVTTQLTGPGHSITANFTNATARDLSAMAAWNYSLASGKSVGVSSVVTLASDAAVPNPSMTLPGLASKEYLWIRASATLGASQGMASAATTGFTFFQNEFGANSAFTAYLGLGAEFRIATATSMTSAPQFGSGSYTQSAVFVAFQEVTPSTGGVLVADQMGGGINDLMSGGF